MANIIKITFLLDKWHLISAADKIELSIESWERLENNLSQEAGLVDVSKQELQNRWLVGLATIIVTNNEIVGYLSYKQLNFPLDKQLYQIYESRTGWIHPSYRGNSLYLKLKTAFDVHILEKIASPCLFVGIAYGLGAGFALRKFGWSIFPAPRANNLLSYLLKEKPENRYDEKPFYHKASDPFTVPNHCWNDYSYLWVSDIKLAESINAYFNKNGVHNGCLSDSS